MQGNDRTTPGLRKTPSGIRGLDEITGGGLPEGRPVLVCGTPGCGKTLLGIEFLVRGALDYGEPGVLLSFEESAQDLAQNTASLGFDLNKLIAQKKLVIDHVRLVRSEIEETGEYDLEGLFVRLGYAIDSIKAKRVVLDTIETLFGGLANEGILRAELRRLFGWLKEKGVTAVITGERGTSSLTRQGLEEYVSDCVIVLDHRVTNQVSTRRVRIVKYRGSAHEANEFPFIIDHEGLTILPITSARLAHKASDERVSTGIVGLDEMLAGKGYFRGSSVLLSGTAGTGKTSVAARFAEAAAGRGQRAMYFAFEESPEQLTRNMRSIGIDLGACPRDKLQIFSDRPTLLGIESHLSGMIRRIDRFRPDIVVVDPITSLLTSSSAPDVQAMLIRLVDHLKEHQITSLFTSLTDAVFGSGRLDATEIGISSIVDTWLILRDIELERQRTRGMHILKSRGMKHSQEVREFT
ncbi:MAG TPA: circadian clock protein KaiC, partial [Burkholderiales bacterium]|nr:circadian clock protein KaiC [Burkholderiales bacterium]